ncbi:hypothetical protein FRX31_020676, partial [Thalictrum thalictroides]
MIKSTIGDGFLAMPEAFHNAGLLVGSVGTMILGVAVLNISNDLRTPADRLGDLVWIWLKRRTETKVFLRTRSKKQEESCSGTDVKGRK